MSDSKSLWICFETYISTNINIHLTETGLDDLFNMTF